MKMVLEKIYSMPPSDVDGLIVMDFADTGFTPTLGQFITSGQSQCRNGGKPAGPGGPGGYFDSGPESNDQLAPLIFPNTDPRLIEKIFRYRRRNPCGHLAGLDHLVHQRGDERAVARRGNPVLEPALVFHSVDHPAVRVDRHAGPWADRAAEARGGQR